MLVIALLIATWLWNFGSLQFMHTVKSNRTLTAAAKQELQKLIGPDTDGPSTDQLNGLYDQQAKPTFASFFTRA